MKAINADVGDFQIEYLTCKYEFLSMIMLAKRVLSVQNSLEEMLAEFMDTFTKLVQLLEGISVQWLSLPADLFAVENLLVACHTVYRMVQNNFQFVSEFVSLNTE